MNGRAPASRSTLDTVDALATFLKDAGIVPTERILDGTFSVSDVSRRNRNHLATWGEDGGVLVKQPGPAAEGAEQSLRNEIAFYAACSRVAHDDVMPLVDVVASYDEPPLLILRLSRDAKSLSDWRIGSTDPRTTFSGLGNALGALHALAASAPFAQDVYARSMPLAHAPWVVSLHKPSPALLRTLSGAHLEMLRIIQRETNLGEHLERVGAGLRAIHVVHGDMKAENVLVSNDGSISIIDWELAQRGDPAWDVGAVLADTLLYFLASLAPKQGTDAAAIVANAAEPTQFAHASCTAFWTGYHSSAGLPAEETTELLSRAVGCAAAHLVRHAFEHGQRRPSTSNHSIAALQVALNLFADPKLGASILFGLKPPGSG